jgi:hypothetical protein
MRKKIKAVLVVKAMNPWRDTAITGFSNALRGPVAANIQFDIIFDTRYRVDLDSGLIHF